MAKGGVLAYTDSDSMADVAWLLAIDQVRDVENNVAPLKVEDTFARLTKFGERFHIETAG